MEVAACLAERSETSRGRIGPPQGRPRVAPRKVQRFPVTCDFVVFHERPDKAAARGVVVPEPPTQVMPVVGMVHAGVAEVTHEIVEELFPVRSVAWARTARITRIVGDCMELEMPEGTYVGSQLLANPRADLRAGRDVVVAVLPNDETVCRYFGGYWQSSTSAPWMITLVARNVSAYPPIIERARECRIVGRVAWMHREL